MAVTRGVQTQSSGAAHTSFPKSGAQRETFMQNPASVQAPAASAIDPRRMQLFLIVLTVASWVGFQGWRTLFNNFAVEVGGLTGFEMGAVQSVREVPGFLALLVIYLLLIFKEHRLIGLSLLVMGAGVASVGFFPSFAGLICTTLIMSFGFHYYETLNQSLTLQYFDVRQAPLVFGKLRAIGAATNIVVGAILFVAAYFFNFTQMFFGLGAVAMLAALWALTQDPTDVNIIPQRKKMVLRRRYWLFYVLTFLSGARRQIFVAFAVFLLVKRFNFSLQEITILFVVNNAINTLASPMIGRAINRFGERAVLSTEYLTLIVVFLTYAFTESKAVVAGMYIVDHLVFNFAMAIRTYFQKIADPADIAPSMAVGFTINHVAAVVIPLAGGALWLFSYKAVFIGGAALALCSLVMAQFVGGKKTAEIKGMPPAA
jgi:hypothetical protein